MRDHLGRMGKERSKMKWEYVATACYTAEGFISRFNEFGQKGWELVIVDFVKGIAIFKRQILGNSLKFSSNKKLYQPVNYD